MARRKLIWHLGLPDPARPVLPGSLAAHADALADLGVRVVATPDEADRATHELLGTHRAAGLRRKDVAGTWAALADRVWSHRGTSVVSTPGLAAADTEQLRLALNPLIGIEVHLVLTVEPLADQVYGAWVGGLLRGERLGLRKYSSRVVRGLSQPTSDATPEGPGEAFAAGHDLAALVSRWGWTLHADRVHLVTGGPRQQWDAVLGLTGLADRAGDLAPVVAPYVDPAAAAVLREVNRRAEGELVPAERLALLAGDDAEAGDSSPVPGRDLQDLAPVVGAWATDLAAAGHDVRGDLHTLLPPASDASSAVALPSPRVRLAVAAEALAEVMAERAQLRERVRELELEVAATDRKRRTWKRRAKAQGTGEGSLRAVG